MKDEDTFKNMDNLESVKVDNSPFYKRKLFLISVAAGTIIIVAIIIIVAASSGDGNDSKDKGNGGDSSDSPDSSDDSSDSSEPEQDEKYCIIGEEKKCRTCVKESKVCATCNPGYYVNPNYNRGEECDVDYSIQAIYKTEKDDEEINLLNSNYKNIITYMVVDGEKKKRFRLVINLKKQEVTLFYLKLIVNNIRKFQVYFPKIKILYM